jgi:hypothetical protein
LPFDDASFDREFSNLVLMFIPDVERAVAEMRRVVRGRLLWDTAAVLDPAAERPRALFSSLTAPGEMSAMWRQVGLTDVEQTSLTICMDYANFDDYWRPLESRDGTVGPYLAALLTSRARHYASM